MSQRFQLTSPSKSPTKIKIRSPMKSPMRLSCHVYGDTASLAKKGIVNGSEIELDDNVTQLLLAGNQLKDFTGFPNHSRMEIVDVSDNPLQDIRGFPKLPRLRHIYVRNTPFSKSHNFRTALLLVCPSLNTINGVTVSTEERKFAATFPRECARLVRAGWCGSSSVPSDEEIVNIRRSLADKVVPGAHRSPRKNGLGKQLKLSELYEEKLEAQEAEILYLTEEIDRIEASRRRRNRH